MPGGNRAPRNRMSAALSQWCTNSVCVSVRASAVCVPPRCAVLPLPLAECNCMLFQPPCHRHSTTRATAVGFSPSTGAQRISAASTVAAPVSCQCADVRAIPRSFLLPPPPGRAFPACDDDHGDSCGTT